MQQQQQHTRCRGITQKKTYNTPDTGELPRRKHTTHKTPGNYPEENTTHQMSGNCPEENMQHTRHRGITQKKTYNNTPDTGELPRRKHTTHQPPGNYPEENIQQHKTPGNYPEENIQHTRCQGIAQKKTYNTPDTGELPRRKHTTTHQNSL
jgi:hypothetical protein